MAEQKSAARSGPSRLLLVGASTRAAAESCRRAGFEPWAIDGFGDADLRDAAHVLAVTQRPKAILEAFQQAPSAPWMYTGALENRPALLHKLARSRPLLGNPAEVVRCVRNPFLVAETLHRFGLPFAEVRRASNPPPADGTWLRKPLRSAGGADIAFWDASVAEHAEQPKGCYFQRFYEGIALGAVFVGYEDRTRFVGMTRQLVGESPAAQPFAYCGSVGPFQTPTRVERVIFCIADALRRAFGLRGLFGCDFVLDEDTPRLVELNPRYTASVEILEWAAGTPLLADHAVACLGASASFQPGVKTMGTAAVHPACENTLGTFTLSNTGCNEVLGKMVLYAPQDMTAGAGPDWQDISSEGARRCADVPMPGTRIRRGHPYCTIFAKAETISECVDELRRRAALFAAQAARCR